MTNRNGFSVTISPKVLKDDDGEKVRDFMREFCRDWCMVQERSAGGHDHWHIAAITADSATTSAVGQKFRRFWEKLDPNYSKNTVVCKKWFKPEVYMIENMVSMAKTDWSGCGAWWEYMMKGYTYIWWMTEPFEQETYMELLWDNIPVEERRSQQKWARLAQLSTAAEKYFVEGKDCYGNNIGMNYTSRKVLWGIYNTLAWRDRVVEIPMCAKKQRDEVLCWWKYLNKYTGCYQNPDDEHKPGEFQCITCKRKADVDAFIRSKQHKNIMSCDL